MKLSRRQALRGLGQLTAGAAFSAGFPALAQQFTASRSSLKAYTPPDWFGDAKFGIWSHWGPQSAVGDGDWYAHWMYVQGHPQNVYHVKRFGPPSKFGYKDTAIPLFTADKWDPEHLMNLYQQAGAKYFFSLAVHHDNYDLWNSTYQPRWNSVASGPHKDIVGMWAAAARRRGLRFGVSEHLSASFNWFATSHLSDTTGPLAGVPYDGADPAFADLYHDYSGLGPVVLKGDGKGGTFKEPERWLNEFKLRVNDLIDQYQPDLLYTDGRIPFNEYGLATVAEIYNQAAHDSRGKTEGVYFSKNPTDISDGLCVLDREAGVLDHISPTPWQTDTCIGQWHYKVGLKYKTPKKVIDLLVDIVSKNGNLLLNFPLPASGELDPEERVILETITQWMAANGEGIFATRPWTINGEGPAMDVKIDPAARYNESKQPQLTASDFRFTSKGKTLFAFIQGWPQDAVTIQALGTSSPQKPAKVIAVNMLGRDENLRFIQGTEGLQVILPGGSKPSTADIGIALRVRFV